MCSFINSLPSEIAFFLKGSHEVDLLIAQENAIELEDNMITSRKMKDDVIRLLVQASIDPLLQKVANEVTILKRQSPTQEQQALPTTPPYQQQQ